ncbi:DNA mismatch repair protein [Pseudoflavitalea sp. X16]|uniref:MutS-related protein n=1 Tax=Paraflavitalea devenefica TaxID=2716334 RepID=UPI001424A183|nr:DNA mismatch repair protein [Paraflavitalea devenefica]NII26258.1 DNA mismatch repair protein [Paraflavitalea devenefica]
MALHTDEQTISDLGIFGRRNSGGIFELYNQTHTRGGETILKEMFLRPLADRDAITQRSSIIGHFARLNKPFPFPAAVIDTAEKYIKEAEEQAKNARHQHPPGEKEIQQGVLSVIELLHHSREFIEAQAVKDIAAYAAEREAMASLLAHPAFEPALREKGKGKLPYTAVAAYDNLFRVREYPKIEQLLKHIYHLDVYLSVAKVAIERKFIFPQTLEKGQCVLKLEGVYHPELKEPVSNTMLMNPGRHVIFLTGANMAGKSTFLRSVSTAVYLAHMGFPVAAAAMEFSVMDGIYTTINLPDNLGIGASHFYAEVLRVKKVATELSQGKSLFVVFDELFRGTNVKDAQEATVAITHAFARKKTSMFIISSHIVEAGEALKQRNDIGFLYLPTRMNGHKPEYTYTLEQGITDDRHGMIIIRNEGILDTLKNGRKAG